MNHFAEPGLGERALVVTAGRVDRGDVTIRMLEHLGIGCALLDLSSAGGDAEVLIAAVRGAHEQLAGGHGTWVGLVGIGRGAGPALAVAATPASGSPPPGVLVVNGRFDAGGPRLAPLAAPGLLLLEGDASWSERRASRRVARELGDHGELVVVRALAGDGAEVLRSWCGGSPRSSAVATGRLDRAALASTYG